ncbi:MAG: DUF2905 domain-containing protein [Gammaproteobacteria bacterium]|nr:DUF2905 domain-containing protein [Gammaproteobacteria bacterium]MDH3411826.1 DUF2905 domain-containing protein [Gammaproteobacteria bacterium]
MKITRILIIAGVTLVALGLLWPWLSQLGLGRLPGDIVIERENFRVYVPITSCLIISTVISILWYLFRS